MCSTPKQQSQSKVLTALAISPPTAHGLDRTLLYVNVMMEFEFTNPDIWQALVQRHALSCTQESLSSSVSAVRRWHRRDDFGTVWRRFIDAVLKHSIAIPDKRSIRAMDGLVGTTARASSAPACRVVGTAPCGGGMARSTTPQHRLQHRGTSTRSPPGWTETTWNRSIPPWLKWPARREISIYHSPRQSRHAKEGRLESSSARRIDLVAARLLQRLAALSAPGQ